MTPKRRPARFTFTNTAHTPECSRAGRGCVLVGTCQLKPAPLPRAVRELLIDVARLGVMMTNNATLKRLPNHTANRAARLLGFPSAWEMTDDDFAIVAKARKAGRR